MLQDIDDDYIGDYINNVISRIHTTDMLLDQPRYGATIYIVGENIREEIAVDLIWISRKTIFAIEADAIIIVDIDLQVLTTEAMRIFYVGASRAKFNLTLIGLLSDEECLEALRSIQGVSIKRKPKKQLATALGAILA